MINKIYCFFLLPESQLYNFFPDSHFSITRYIGIVKHKLSLPQGRSKVVKLADDRNLRAIKRGKIQSKF